jgi:transcriptional regulator with XRE-family HTH domain
MAAPSSTPHQTRVGARLRRIRRQRGLALSAVADGTAISTSFLSLVENGRSDTTLGRLQRLLDFYGITYSDLLPEEEPQDARLVRAEERRHLPSPAEGIDIALLTHGSGHEMVAILAEYAVGAHLHDYAAGTGEAFLHVLDGELRVTLGGAEALVVGAGDSLYYDTSTSLEIRNEGAAPARLLAVGNHVSHLQRRGDE